MSKILYWVLCIELITKCASGAICRDDDIMSSCQSSFQFLKMNPYEYSSNSLFCNEFRQCCTLSQGNKRCDPNSGIYCLGEVVNYCPKNCKSISQFKPQPNQYGPPDYGDYFPLDQGPGMIYPPGQYYDPYYPYNPSVPIGPINPSFPVNPSVPIGPVNPSVPIGSVNPSFPVNPSVPIGPINPSFPVNPSVPIRPINPSVPIGPVSPSFPVNPSVPIGPVPIGPVNPSVPIGPINPSVPIGSVNPSAPIVPFNPFPGVVTQNLPIPVTRRFGGYGPLSG